MGNYFPHHGIGGKGFYIELIIWRIIGLQVGLSMIRPALAENNPLCFHYPIHAKSVLGQRGHKRHCPTFPSILKML